MESEPASGPASDPDADSGAGSSVSPPPRRQGAGSVAAGILASRIFGLVREQSVAYFFGVGPHADALTAALRVPNALQNLLGEGALSASFIPIYSRLLAAGRDREAGRFAGAIFGLLLAAAGAVSLLGMLLARPLVALLAPGFLGDAGAVAAGRLLVDRFALAVGAVRILFPMTGLIVLSVWALAILNSHRRFFLPYFAPVLWNAAMITALFWAAGRHIEPSLALSERLFHAFCWGALVGGALQLLVQLPLVIQVTSGFQLSFSRAVPGVREALRAWGPVVAGRGVVQLAGYLDLFLATWLVTGAASADRYAQMLYILPISLFGMSIAASELPELSRLVNSAEALLSRVHRALGAVAFLNVPTVLAYLAFGYLVAGALYGRGRFNAADNWLVYLALCGYSTGILATTSSRLLQNTFYALGDTRTPARIAVSRVATSAAIAIPLMLWLDRYPLSTLIASASSSSTPGVPPLHLGVVGLAVASGCGAWLELTRLRRALRARLAGFELPWRAEARIAAVALGAAALSAVLWRLLRGLPVVPLAAIVLGTYGTLYLLGAQLARIEAAAAWTAILRRRLRKAT